MGKINIIPMKASLISIAYKITFVIMLALWAQSAIAQHQNALDFDGLDDQVYTSIASNFINGANQVSMSCWVYPTNPNPVFPDFDGFCGFRNDVDLDFYLVQIGADRVEARFRNSAGVSANIVFIGLVLNSWNHFVFSFDGNYVRLYYNGSLVDSLTATGTVVNTNEDFYIGNVPYFSTDYLLDGMMDEVALWNRALTPVEVSCIYSGGVNPGSPNLQLYYSMNEGTSGGVNTSVLSLKDFSPNMADATFSGLALTGTSSNFVNGTMNYSVTPIVICPGDSYSFGTQNLTTSGYYMEGFSTSGCDSIAEVVLTVEALSTAVSISNETLTADQTGASYQWLDCDNSFSIIAGETGQSFIPTVNGNYAVIISSGTCSDTSICMMMNSVGVNDLSSVSDLKIYPNPIENRLAIDLTMIQGQVSMKITGAMGELVYTATLNGGVQRFVNTEKWAQGIYLLKLGTDRENKSVSILKR